ncbi:hypothetical protein AB4536_17030 [Vibrio cyclitrophicus]
MISRKIKILYKEAVKVLYYAKTYWALRECLLINGVINIKPFLFRRWRAGCAYYTGFLNGEKVFLKVDTKLFMLKNEKAFYDCVGDKLGEKLLELHFFHESPEFQVACFSFSEEGKELSPIDLINHPEYLKEILNILLVLKRNKIIHRDIKLDNFILDKGRVKIIDFYFSNSLTSTAKFFVELDVNNDEYLSVLKRLGDRFKPSYFVWNDFISFKNILEEIIRECNLPEEKLVIFYNVIEESESYAKGAYYIPNFFDYLRKVEL